MLVMLEIDSRGPWPAQIGAMLWRWVSMYSVVDVARVVVRLHWHTTYVIGHACRRYFHVDKHREIVELALDHQRINFNQCRPPSRPPKPPLAAVNGGPGDTSQTPMHASRDALQDRICTVQKTIN